jgi:hypothetical protein
LDDELSEDDELSDEVEVPVSLEVEPDVSVDVEVSLAVDPVELAFCAELAVEVEPSEPVPAITPNARANVASAAAVTRRRIVRTRWARARSRWRTRSESDLGGGV